MMAGLRGASRRPRDLRRSLRRARARTCGPGRGPAPTPSQPDRQHAAGDADRGRRGVARVARGAAAPQPAMVAGHSLGEYTALVAAGALAFGDALPLVRFRAQAMQEAVPAGVGAMAAILGLDDAGVAAACAEAAQGQVVEPVNFNTRRTGGDRRPHGGGRARGRRGQGARRQARACCCRCRRRSTARC